MNKYFSEKLKEEISTAIAWGIPDNESMGYSSYEFTNLLARALKRIKELETIVGPEEQINDI